MAFIIRLLQGWAWEDSNFRPHAYQACALTGWATSPCVLHKTYTTIFLVRSQEFFTGFLYFFTSSKSFYYPHNETCRQVYIHFHHLSYRLICPCHLFSCSKSRLNLHLMPPAFRFPSIYFTTSIAKTHNCMNKIFKFFFIFPLILSLLFATVPDSSTVVNFFISYNPYIFNHKYMNDTNGTQQI